MSDIDNRRQQEAIERAREMYSRRTPDYHTGGFPSGYNGNIKRRTSARADREDNFPQTNSDSMDKSDINTESEDKTDSKSKEDSFLDMLLADKERTLIILLLALLSEEKANTSLMLALMYIIM